MNMDPFRTLVRTEGVRLYRDLPWRRTRDPYEIWLSEVMLQQTQVARVETRWAEWLDRFPSVFALAEAGTAEVLAALVRATCPDGGACVLESGSGGNDAHGLMGASGAGDAHGLMGASGGNDAHGLTGGSADGGARHAARLVLRHAGLRCVPQKDRAQPVPPRQGIHAPVAL